MNKIRIAGAAAGVVLVSGIVLQVSSAAFTDTTENAGNTWDAGTVYLSDSQNGTALFSSTSENIVPGYNESKCILVTYDGTVDPSAAISFATALTSNVADDADGDGAADDGDGLANDLDVTLDIGPAGSSCDDLVDGLGGILNAVTATNLYTGTLDGLAAEGTVSSGWTPDGDGGTDLSRPFRFSVEMPDASTPNDAQGDSAVATFTWSSTS